MRLLRLLPVLALVALFPLLARAATGVAAPVIPAAPSGPPQTINKLNLRDAPVQMVLDLLEQWTGKIVLRPQSLQAAVVTINIPSPVSLDEAIQAVLSVLQINGVGVVPMGEKFLVVLNTGAANGTVSRAAPELITGSSLGLSASSRVVMKIFELNFQTSQAVVQQVTNLLTQGLGQAVAIPNSNVFYVTDTLANVQRVETLVNSFDRPTGSKVETVFIKLKNAQASAMQQSLAGVLQQGPLAPFAQNLSLYADTRTNQLLITGVKEQFDVINKLVEGLDKEDIPNTQVRTFKLKTATANSVSQTLTTLIQNSQNAAAQITNQRGVGANQRGAGANGGAAGGAAGGRAAGAAGTGAAGAAAGGAAGGAAVAAGAPAGGGVATGASGGSPTDFSSYLTFVPDTRNNAIIAQGTPGDLTILEKLINSMDSPLPQVRIEVVIVDVSLNDQFDSGISALGLEIKNDRLVGISGSATGLTLGGSVTSSATSTTFARLLDPTKIVSNTGLTAIVNLATTPRKSDARIVSSPTIRTMHNSTATIFVGENRSFANGSVNGGTNGGTTTTFQQLPIGVTLTVTPLIGSDGTVQMTIQQNVSDFAGNDTKASLSPLPAPPARPLPARVARFWYWAVCSASATTNLPACSGVFLCWGIS